MWESMSKQNSAFKSFLGHMKSLADVHHSRTDLITKTIWLLWLLKSCSCYNSCSDVVNYVSMYIIFNQLFADKHPTGLNSIRDIYSEEESPTQKWPTQCDFQNKYNVLCTFQLCYTCLQLLGLSRAWTNRLTKAVRKKKLLCSNRITDHLTWWQQRHRGKINKNTKTGWAYRTRICKRIS